MYRIITHMTLFIFLLLSGPSVLLTQNSEGRKIDDLNFRFSFVLPDNWVLKDQKETRDNDGISYSFEKNDRKMTMMLLAFKLSSVKNIDDFIYNLEKDVSLNIPPISGGYSEADSTSYDIKSAVYTDSKFHENIYYFRTKLPDAPNNYVYMVRFIMDIADANSDSNLQIMQIINTFSPKAE